MKTIHVLGTGPGIENYERDGVSEAIGVNDIFKYHPVEYLLIMDNRECFPPDRLSTIVSSKPIKTFSQLSEWQFMPGFTPITVNRIGGDVSTLGFMSCLPKHVDSTFTAASIAFCMGAKKIVMYGVEFHGHPVLNRFQPQILDTYKRLSEAMKAKGVKLCIASKTSMLTKVLPFYHKYMEKETV